MLIKQYFLNFFKYTPLMFILTSKDFKLKYRRSFLGIVWSMLNPLLTMLVVTLVFAKLMKCPPNNMPFAIFYITGSSLFNFFSEATTTSLSSVIFNAQLIQKVYIPKYIFPVEKCMFAFLNTFFSFIAVFFVILFYVMTGEVQLHFTIILSLVPLIFVFLFSIGISLILSSLAIFFRDLMHIWGVIITMWTFLTPVIYSEEILINEGLGFIFKFNPMYYFLDDFRKLLILGIIPNISHFLASCLFCFVAIFIGVVVFKKTQNRFILYI